MRRVTGSTGNTAGHRNVWLYLAPFFRQHSFEQPQHPKVYLGRPHCVTGVPLPEPTAEARVVKSIVMRALIPVNYVRAT